MELTQERLQVLLKLDFETGVFTWRSPPSNRARPGDIAGMLLPNGRRTIKIGGKSYLADRLVWLYAYGELLSCRILHINGQKDDNRPDNLNKFKSETLTQSELKTVLSYNPSSGLFARKITTSPKARSGDIAGYIAPDGYRYIRVNSCKYLAHRLAWLYVYGSWPEDQIDHINQTKQDNRIRNLRAADSKINGKNCPRNSRNTSGFVGVYCNKSQGRWYAQITVDGSVLHLGCFAKKADAIAARKAANIKYNFHPNHGK